MARRSQKIIVSGLVAAALTIYVEIPVEVAFIEARINAVEQLVPQMLQKIGKHALEREHQVSQARQNS
jgi:hypothetical protein